MTTRMFRRATRLFAVMFLRIREAEGRIGAAAAFTVLAVIAVVSPARAQQPAHLVKDINPGADPEWGLNPRNFVTFNGAVYFHGSDDFHGQALWRSDGTAEGTRVFLDFEPGGWDGGHFALAPAGDRLFIVRYPSEVWMSDGTVAGTRRIAKLTGAQISSPISVGSTVFFSAYLTAERQWALGRSDGSEAGTFLLHEFDAPVWSQPGNFVAGDNLLYFRAISGGRDALWRSDGSRAGTFPILPTSFRVAGGATIGDTLLFNHCVMTTSPPACELWRTDGSVASTRLLVDIGSAIPASPNGFAAVGTRVYFTAQDGTGYGVWTSDGSAEGTIRLASRLQVYGNTYETTPRFVDIGSIAVFVASGVDGPAIWRSDGTPEGTRAVASIPVHPYDVGLFSGTSVAYALVTSYNADFSTARFLWAVDGTAAGTHAVTSVDDGFYIADAAVAGDRVYFASATPESGMEVWTADTAGARIVFDSTPASSAWPTLLTPVGSTLFMIADANHATDAPSFNELWKSDGTTGGTSMVADLTPGLQGTNFRYSLMVPAPTQVFFTRYSTSSLELWTSDGTTAGTIKLADNVSDAQYPRDPVASTLFFARRAGSTWEVWKSDGTLVGTVRVKTLPPNRDSWRAPDNFRPVGDVVYFLACTDAHGCEPWLTDGTDAGTRIVADLVPGGASSHASNFTAFGGQVFFRASRQFWGTELWRTDGTTEGTTVVHGVEGGSIYSLTSLGMRLVFGVAMPARNELWSTDGTPAGATVIGEFPLRPYPGNLSSFTAIGDVMLFTADDGTHGLELWRTDGTADGTAMIVDLSPGEHGGADFGQNFKIVVSGLRAAFTGTTLEHGREVFVSDGTAGGTRLLTDINPGAESSNAYELAVAGSNLYIAAGRPDVGFELWTVVLSPGSAIDNLAQELDLLAMPAGALQSLKAKLQAALKALERGNTATAASLLQAFIQEIEAFSGKKIDEADAAALIESARRILESLESF